MTYNHKDIRRDTIRGNSFVTSVQQMYVFLFLKKLFFWDDMLYRWVNIWRSIVPPCSRSNNPRRLLDNRKSSKSLKLFTRPHNVTTHRTLISYQSALMVPNLACLFF